MARRVAVFRRLASSLYARLVEDSQARGSYCPHVHAVTACSSTVRARSGSELALVRSRDECA